VNPVRVFHVSDLHFGRPVDSLLIEAIEDHIAQDKYDVIAVSGDLSQRSRAGEFQRASVFLRDASKVSRVIVVPGNHDVAWWRSPMMIRGSKTIYEPYRRYVSRELEPVLRVPGATFVGLNTAQGVSGEAGVRRLTGG
jgi:3',5'-cyclic AMP phosphodiesterase CpdA